MSRAARSRFYDAIGVELVRCLGAELAAEVGEDRVHERALVGSLHVQLREHGARLMHAVLREAGVSVVEGGHGISF